MPDTLSPTTDHASVDFPAPLQKAAYQRLLLAQMGITPWVGQSQPVQSFVPEEWFDRAIDINAVSQSPSPSAPTGFLQHPPLENRQVNHAPALKANTLTGIESSEVATFQKPSIAIAPTANTSVPHTENTPLIRCYCYAIKIQDWVIVADADFLASQPQALRLWQNICHSLSAHQYEFRFPVLPANPTVATGNNTLLLQASFAGFLCALERASYLDNTALMASTTTAESAGQSLQKVGVVTPLIDCLENEQLRRLPYLTEMLEDYRQKRQFWQLMIANEG